MNRQSNIFAKLDWITVGIYFALIILGWINIYAAVYNEEHSSIFDMSQRYGKQVLWIFAAIVLAYAVVVIDIRFYNYFAYVIYLLMILFLLAVLIFGTDVHGARSWFTIGDLRIQPSEFSKFATVLAVSKFISSYNINIKSFKHLAIALMLIALPPLMIIAQPDAGSAMVYASFMLILYREGAPRIILVLFFLLPILFILTLVLSPDLMLVALIIASFISYIILFKNHKALLPVAAIISVVTGLIYLINHFLRLNFSSYFIVLGFLLIVGAMFIFVSYKQKMPYLAVIIILFFSSVAFTRSVDFVFHNVMKEHQRQRVNIMLGIDSDPLGVGYNVNQSKIAIGSGGFFGKGFLQGTQTKYDFVPEQTTDFIFCTVGEEWGFVGTFILVILFTALVLRMLMLAERQRLAFARIYGYGAVAIIFFHIAINIGMTIGLFPVIGIPLPFFSYGGSSLWAFTILLFILITIDAQRLDVLA